MSLGTSAWFCFCFVSAAAARRNDVDVIANPTTGCETHSLANGAGGMLYILCVATISAIVAMQIRRRHMGKSQHSSWIYCSRVIDDPVALVHFN